MVNFALIFAALAAPLALAHPGEHHSQDFLLKERQELEMHARHIQRGLNACAQHPRYLALQARGQARRADMAKAIRHRRNLTAPTKRDATQLAEYAAKSHNSSTSGYTVDTDADTLFGSNKNASCVLTPKVTEGPYYVTGEYYRSDVTDGEPGIPLHLEYQYIDISTCDAAEGLYIEHWHANSTGVYSGVSASGNGVGSADPSNLNKTFLRGVQKTDSSGVVAFDTVFPGHYSGRTVHIHMMAHQNGTIESNNTFTSASVSQVGQVFFDQDLITDVSAVEPYSSNTQSLTTNTEDSIAAGEADNFDPFAEYAYLGDSISDGLLAWIHIGIDMSASYSVSAGAHFYATGGVSGEGMGGGAGSPGGSMSGGAGGPPSGAMPTGVPPTGAGGMSGAVPTASGSAGSAPSGSAGTNAPSGSAPSGSAPAGSGSSAAQPSGSGTQAASSGTNTSSAFPSVSSSGASRGRGGKSVTGSMTRTRTRSKSFGSHKSGTHKNTSHKHTGTANAKNGAQKTGKAHSTSCKDAKATGTYKERLNYIFGRN